MKDVSKKTQSCCSPTKRSGSEVMPCSVNTKVDPAWLCYCFDISTQMIQKKINETGNSNYSEWIRQEIEAGRCDCETKNPSGRCCLGEVIASEKNFLKIPRR